MIPTTKFRYVERDSYEHNGEHFIHPHRVRILQQWWEDKNNILHSTRTNETEWVKHYAGEWRDIPLEQEA
jgi:hypothetical protein